MGHGVDKGDIGAGHYRQVVVGLNVRGADQFDFARVDNNEFGPFAQAFFQSRAKYWVGVGGVGAHHHHHVGLCNRGKRLSACRFAQRGF